MLDYTSFDAMLEARLDALAVRAARGSSFSTGVMDEVDPVWHLVELARAQDDGRDEMFSFDDADAGLWDTARQECADFLERALELISHPASVRSPELGTRIHTNVSWTGDTTTLVQTRVSSAQIEAHMTRVGHAIERSHRLLRMLTSILVAAGRIAVIIATPAGAARAVPIAYRCVKEVWKQWQSSQSVAS